MSHRRELIILDNTKHGIKQIEYGSKVSIQLYVKLDSTFFLVILTVCIALLISFSTRIFFRSN